MKQTKRLMAMLLAIAMVLAMLPVSVMAADEESLAGKTVILHTNDVHGAIEGYAVVAALKAELTAEGAEVILVDAGDYSQGTTYVSTTKGADAIDMMNIADYDIATIGNHEFDYGYAQLAANMENAEFEVVCADVFDADGNTIFDDNYIYTTESGVDIGFFGLETPEAQTKANPALITGLTFVAGEALYDCAQEQVEELEAQGADIIVCLAHLGVDAESEPNRSYDLWDNTTGIDFIIDGHSHTVMTEGENGEPIQSTGTAFANIGVVVIDDETMEIEDNYLQPVTEDMTRDADVDAAAQAIIDRVNEEYGAVFAKSEVDLNGDRDPGNRTEETNLGDLITDAMLWSILKDPASISVDADHVVAVTNGGGIRAPIAAGDISKNDINTVLPFGNTVAVVYVTGAELLEALEASTYCTPTAIGGFPQIAGMEITIDTTKEYDANEETYPGSTYYGPASINRVTIDSVGGEPFDEEDVYAVVTNNFCAAGGDTYYAFASASSQFDTGLPLDEVVMDFITTELGGVVGEEYAAPEGRIFVDALGAPFEDVTNTRAYYYIPVQALKEAGVIKGITDTTFEPATAMTRGMMVTYLYRLVDEEWQVHEKDGSEYYPDVTAGSYCDEAIGWATEMGIVEGYPDGTFCPQQKITRQEMAAMIYRFCYDGEEDYENPSSEVYQAADWSTVNNYARAAMSWCVDMGLINGMDTSRLVLAPANTAQRAQSVTILFRMLLLFA